MQEAPSNAVFAASVFVPTDQANASTGFANAPNLHVRRRTAFVLGLMYQDALMGFASACRALRSLVHRDEGSAVCGVGVRQASSK